LTHQEFLQTHLALVYLWIFLITYVTQIHFYHREHKVFHKGHKEVVFFVNFVCVFFVFFVVSRFSAYYSFSQTFTIIPSVTNVTCPGGNDGIAAVTVMGGTPPYTYLWNPSSQTTSSATALSAGNYSVTITDNAGNDSIFSISVSQPQPISDNPDIQSPFCTSNGHIILSPTGGTPPYSFNWNDGSTYFFINNAGPGNYSMFITDANNCTASFSYSLTETECFVTPSSYFTPNGDDINDTWDITNSQYFPDARVIVFDRWGTRVWEHKGLYEPWDGRSYLGIPVPDAVYYYFFFQDKDDKQKEAKRGSVTIIR
jgi:gliding motility-associated-like protein